MNKRYLGIGLFFSFCSLYSLYQSFRNGFDFVPLSLFLVFGFLASLFLRHARK